MKTSVSLWSADLLDIGVAMDRVESVVVGFHIDVMDGHFVPELLFGPDIVRAVARRTQRQVDVHLMVDDAELWIQPFAAAGADMLTVHQQSCKDVAETLSRMEALGVRPGLAVGIDDPLELVWGLLDKVDRVLLMGTRLGIKGVEIEPTIYDRIRSVVRERERSARQPEVFVDGGIRRHTIPRIAEAGADGVAPGSLVFGEADPAAAVAGIAAQHRAAQPS